MKKMNKATYDSRFFVEFYYSKDQALRQKMAEKKRFKDRYVSTIVIHEVYNLSLSKEGRDVAKLRAMSMKEEFQLIPVDDQIAQVSAELRHKYRLSMGDSIIAATASDLRAVLISDDPHFKQIKEIETTWI
jgi:predicted nucleic acid-binding protein